MKTSLILTGTPVNRVRPLLRVVLEKGAGTVVLFGGGTDSEEIENRWPTPEADKLIDLVILDTPSRSREDNVRQVVSWCLRNQIPLLIADESRITVESITGPLEAQELRLEALEQVSHFLTRKPQALPKTRTNPA